MRYFKFLVPLAVLLLMAIPATSTVAVGGLESALDGTCVFHMADFAARIHWTDLNRTDEHPQQPLLALEVNTNQREGYFVIPSPDGFGIGGTDGWTYVSDSPFLGISLMDNGDLLFATASEGGPPTVYYRPMGQERVVSVAYALNPIAGPGQVFSAHVPGSGLTVFDLEQQEATLIDSDGFSGSWSPDGSMLAYHTYLGQLRTYEFATGNIGEIESAHGLFAHQPIWADEQTLLFSATQHEDDFMALYLVDSAGEQSPMRWLAEANTNLYDPYVFDCTSEKRGGFNA